MQITDILLLSLIGFSIVFVVLLVLMLLVRIISTTGQSSQVAGVKPALAVTPKAPESIINTQKEQVEATGSLGELNLNDVDEKTAAMLMAIVANKLDTPLNCLRFKSIREIK